MFVVQVTRSLTVQL